MTPTAQANVGRMYYYGEGVEKDYEKAFQWRSVAAKKNIAEAVHGLRIAYQEGHGVEQNDEKAFQFF